MVSFCATALTECAPPGKSAQVLATSTVDNLGCTGAQSEMWSGLQKLAESGDEFPGAARLKSELLRVGTERGLDLAEFADAFIANYETTIGGIQDSFGPRDVSEWKKALAEMEIGIRVTSVHAQLQGKIQTSLDRLAASDRALKVNCTQPEPPVVVDTPTPATAWAQLLASGVSPEVYGARRALAVAYQSCDALNLAPMSAATPGVQGIKSIGVRSDGGQIRDIASLAALTATDYYIAGLNLAQPSCFDVRKKPLIYNFGGKPFTVSAKPQLLDLFTHISSGGPTLGIDCSGYVFSALALAGLKLDPKPTSVMKADLVQGLPSGAFKEPQANNLGCLQKISVTAETSILPGDIAAINGHVVMVDSVGADPLAIAFARSFDDCTSAKIKPSAFNFVIAQSAPIKGGIGINRIRAVDYMPESTTIRNGFIAYAVAACRARFSGSAEAISPDFSLVRHTKTKACLAPKPLVMTHEECIATCPGK